MEKEWKRYKIKEKSMTAIRAKEEQKRKEDKAKKKKS